MVCLKHWSRTAWDEYGLVRHAHGIRDWLEVSVFVPPYLPSTRRYPGLAFYAMQCFARFVFHGAVETVILLMILSPGNHGRRRLPVGHLRAVVSRARMTAAESRSLHGLVSAVLQHLNPEHPLEAAKRQRKRRGTPDQHADAGC